MAKLFGTDGVRGIANQELTPELAFKLGVAGTYVLSKGNNSKKPLVIIGKDTRISGDMLEDALSAGILSMGGTVLKAGVLPTPGIAYLTRIHKADAGVVISASHNPFEYNGIKFFNSKGFKLDDSIEEEIEKIILENIDVNSHISGEGLGRIIDGEDDAAEQYTDFLVDSTNISLADRKIVLDCANGAAYEVAEKVYSRLGVDVVLIGNTPNGININDGYGSTHPDKLQKKVIEEKAYMGFAYDGDADRLIAVDERGNIIDGDKIMYICAKHMKSEGTLVNDLVTGTVMSNIGLNKALSSIGCAFQQSGVGDRYVLEMMQETGSVLGGEQSGHVIFLTDNTTGDGVFASLKLMEAVIASEKTASEIAEEVTIFPQILVNAKVKNENKHLYGDDVEIRKMIENIEYKMDGTGRVLIRPSGTEPLVRVMIEGDNQDEMEKMARELADFITNKLGS